MSGARPAIRDTVLEIRTEIHETPPGCPPMPAIPRTLRCKQCGRVCRTDTAIMPEVSPW